MRHLCYINKQVTGRETDSSITRLKGAKFFASFLLYRKDRLWRSLELKNARTEAGTTTRRFLD